MEQDFIENSDLLKEYYNNYKINKNREIEEIIHLNNKGKIMLDLIKIDETICEIEHINELESKIEDDVIFDLTEDDKYIDSYEACKEDMRWRYRCNLREQMAPIFYETYFLPFFNTTLKEVYDNNLTEELKFYKPSFKEWVFMVQAVMTEYYYREEYPFTKDSMSWFKLDLDQGNLKTDIYNRYKSVTW